ncbi:MAG: hypothetical protein VX643_04315 [Chloroflexota bacterium]|nr:hypothetical protein [Chloroflexota bacterium]
MVNTSCVPTDTDIRTMIEEEIASALALIPTITPIPTATAQPTPTLRPFPERSTPVIFPTPWPTPTPMIIPATPTPYPILPTSTPKDFAKSDKNIKSTPIPPQLEKTIPSTWSLMLNWNPTKPVTGRDIDFTLTGLNPWQRVKIYFVNPLGNESRWIDPDREVNLVNQDGVPMFGRAIFADKNGQARWSRIATLDHEGVWGIRMELLGDSVITNYNLLQMELPNLDSQNLGIELRKYQGSFGNIYYSAGVPTSLVVDLQYHLKWVVAQMNIRSGLQSTEIPDIYLAANQSLFKELATATDVTIGFESGFYKKTGRRPGIYMRTDFLRTELFRILTHEYVHLIIGDQSQERDIPSWLNEGTAQYYEYALNLDAVRPDITRLRMYQASDVAKSAALDGVMIGLRNLENQSSWNSQANPEQILLQYSEAYMAVKYLNDTYGEKSSTGVIKNIARGGNIFDAIQDETEISYHKFRDDFTDWIRTLEYSERRALNKYVSVLKDVTEQDGRLFTKRAQEMQLNRNPSERIIDKENLVNDANYLIQRLQGFNPPPSLMELNQDSLIYLSKVKDWLTLELTYVRTADEKFQVGANEMIPEIEARGTLLNRAITNFESLHNLKALRDH